MQHRAEDAFDVLVLEDTEVLAQTGTPQRRVHLHAVQHLVFVVLPEFKPGHHAFHPVDELTGPFESIVEMSCLMHDIGNPPFGHFGEAAINDWFRQRLHPEDAESQPLTDDRCSVAALRLRDGHCQPTKAIKPSAPMMKPVLAGR